MKHQGLEQFVREWSDTLETLRVQARIFEGLGMRPPWIGSETHPTLHFDRFLQAYEHDFVMSNPDDGREERSARIERTFQARRANPAGALLRGALWWTALPPDAELVGEEELLKYTAPRLERLLSRQGLRTMTRHGFVDAMTGIQEFRRAALRTRIPPEEHSETAERRAARLAGWLWDAPEARAHDGRTVREVLQFMVWGDKPSDLEVRLWLAAEGPTTIPHLGLRTLAEAVGRARPDEYPPRASHTNTAMRLRGFDVMGFEAHSSAPGL